MRKAKIIKILILMMILTFGMVFSFSLKAANGEVDLTINEEVVKYYNSNEVITIPENYEYNLFEMRGMWVSTVWNENFRTSSTVNSFKLQYTRILDNLQKSNFNAIFFQIRPSNDAFYISELNPWSEWMTGTQGKDIKNSDGTVFDPLEWMIEETHARNMKFYGWMNAYRVSARTLFTDDANSHTDEEVKTAFDKLVSSLDNLNWAKSHPHYLLIGDIDSKVILNPGEPKVRDFLVSSVREIVTKYDIDGVHFDDYFYLDSKNSSYAERIVSSQTEYDAADTAFHDLYSDYNTYMIYRESVQETLADFRRRSVNLMMRAVSNMIKEVNNEEGKTVEFGAKPAAVWTSASRNVSGRIKGANVLSYSYSSYFDIFADSLLWAEEGIIDWIAPQIYFNFTNREVPYADIVKWWAESIQKSNELLNGQGKKGVDLFIAHGVYRLDQTEEASKRFTDPTELVKQLLFNQKYDVIKGSAFYDYSTFFTSTAIAKNTRENLTKIWNLKTLPETPKYSEAIYLDNIVIDKENKQLQIFNTKNDIYGYIIYKCDKKENCTEENIYDVVLSNSELVSSLDDIDATYFVQVVDKSYTMSNIYFEVNDNITYVSQSMYVGDEYKIDSNYQFVSSTNSDFTSSDGILKATKEGQSCVTFKDKDKYIIYVCTAQNVIYYNVVIATGEGYNISMDTTSPVREGTDITFTLTLEEAYSLSNTRIKVNNSSAPIKNTYTIKNVQKDLNISITGVEVNKYTVTINNGGDITTLEVLHGDDITLPTPATLENKTFLQWSSDGKNIKSDLVINALYQNLQSVCSFEVNGGEKIESKIVKAGEYLEEVIPVRNGYKFIGWYLDEELETLFTFDNNITDDLILYAKWEKLFIITYDLDGGTCENLITEFSSFEEVALPLPTKKGHEFLGWYNLDGEKIEVLSNQDYYLIAKWNKTSGCDKGTKIFNFIFTIPIMVGIILRRKKQ